MTKTILVVDDEERLVSLLKAYLSNEGFRVVSAKNGRDALFQARNEKPDLILLDIMMPEMDGYEFIRLHRKERETPIILLTAKIEESDKVAGLELGADDYLVKPFAFSELLLTDHSHEINDETQRYIHFIKELSENTLGLLTKLLNVSIIESGQINIMKHKQNYIDFVKQHMFLNQILADKKGMVLRLETDLQDIKISFDEHYLSEVINNLLSNAIKFSFPQSIISINVRIVNNNRIRTEVIDHGQGIPHNEQQKLFNYFLNLLTENKLSLF